MSPATLAARVAEVRDRINAACRRVGRTDEVTLIAVTKTYPVEFVRQVVDAGITDIGENRVQELEQKVAAAGRDIARWHLVGHLQRNKVRRALSNFDLLHSLDSIRLAQQLSEHGLREGRIVESLIQVNTSGETSKYGFGPEAAVSAVGEIVELPGIRVIGMMAMAPFTAEEDVIRRTFRDTRRLSEEVVRQVGGYEARHLSMGMSNDYQIAVEEGSTMVRLGTALLGERNI